MSPIVFLNVINAKLILFSTAFIDIPTISAISLYFFFSILLNKKTSLCFTGKEEIEGGALAGVNKATMRVRSDAVTKALTEADRVNVRGSLWNIRSIIQSNRQNSIIEMIIEKGIAT